MAREFIQATTNDSKIVGYLDWSSVTDYDLNKSTVSTVFRLSRTDNNTTSGNGSWTLTINGVSYTFNSYKTISYNSETYIFGQMVEVPHNTDGTKTITITVTGGIAGTSYTSTNCSGTAVMDNIPRTGTPTLSSYNVPYGEQVTIYTHRPNAEFTYRLRADWNLIYETIATNVEDSFVWTIPLSYMNRIPNLDLSWGTIYVDAFRNGTYIETNLVRLDTPVPTNIVPIIGTFTDEEMEPNVLTSGISSYLQNMSKIKFTLNNITTQYGASLVSYSITIDDKVYNNVGEVTTDTIRTSTPMTVVAKAVDTRGRVTTIIKPIEPLPYTKPNIVTFTTARCNADGSSNEFGAYCKIIRQATASSIDINGEQNYIGCTVIKSIKGMEDWSELTDLRVYPNQNLTTSVDNTPFIIPMPLGNSFDIKFIVSDMLDSVERINTVSQGKVIMALGSNKVGIGMLPQNNTGTESLHVNGGIEVYDGDIFMASDTDSRRIATVPIGGIIYYARTYQTDIYTPFINCNGSQLSKTLFPELFEVIGYTYGGSGDNFLVPDLRDDFIRVCGSDRQVGTRQSDSIKSHSHSYAGLFQPNYAGADDYSNNYPATGDAGSPFNRDFSAWIGYTGDSETRPRNMALQALIRYV